MTAPTLILGSGSPRRHEILSFFDIPFTQRNSNFDEDSIPFDGDPFAYVKNIALGKLSTLLETSMGDEVIVTADSIVFLNGKVYGKPKDWNEAERFLHELSGKEHEVYTGLSIARGEFRKSLVTVTRVKICALNAEQIHAYVRQIHALDKAAGYAIQGAGGLITESIEGCYYNVMGLPLQALSQLLAEAGLDLWQHMKERHAPTIQSP